MAPELDILVHHGRRELARSGNPQLVVLAGEAGIGKSRLLQASLDRARAAGDRVLVGHAVDIGSAALPFVSVAEMLRQLVAESDEAQLARLLGRTRRELSWLVPSLGATRVTHGDEEEGRRDRLFAAIVDLVGRMRDEQPLVLAFEDIHWADDATLDLLRYLARAVSDGSLLLLATLRDDPALLTEELRDLLAELSRSPHVARIDLGPFDLGPFDRVAVDAQVAAITGERGGWRTVADLVARSDGNPFFVEELLATEVGDELPPAVRDVVRARLHAVPDQTRQLVVHAATVGERFTEELLKIAAGIDVDTLADQLRPAVEEQLVVEDADGALRGGGGNVGIVTSFEFRLHPVGPEVLTVQLFHRMAGAREVLRSYRDVMADAPDELSCYPMILHAPPVEPFPPELHGEPIVALIGCYSGEVGDGEAAVAPLAAIGQPFLDVIAPMPYADFQSSYDAGTPDGVRYYGEAHMFDELSDAAIDALLGAVGDLPGDVTAIFFESLGGAIARLPADATAWPHRDAAYGFAVQAGWTDPEDDDAHIGWVRQVHEALAPHATGGVYVNYLDVDDADRVAAAYGDHRRRLARIKQDWDPDNLFRANHNVAPDGHAD